MCGGVNDSDGENISNDKAHFSLLLILLSLLFFDLLLWENMGYLSLFFQVGSRYL